MPDLAGKHLSGLDLSGKDRLEGRLEPAMCRLQRIDAASKHVILPEHFLDGTRLRTGELSVNIGHEQFVAELGHAGSSLV